MKCILVGKKVHINGHKNMGKTLQNVGPKWYIEEGGSFCSRCRIAYNFNETLFLYLRCLRLNIFHGIPRCINCGRRLRTRSKHHYESGFWEKLKHLKNNGGLSSEHANNRDFC